ncbi:MAG: hypothetical protein GXO83_00955, partial [Chlorobi bacterium]|nr:hypothetical protein [Chlorobiota bacterium]
GLGAVTTVDSLVVDWPDGRCTVNYDVAANQFLVLDEKKEIKPCMVVPGKHPPVIFHKINGLEGLDFKHRENDFVDFGRNRLLFQMLSNEGPHSAVGDVNGDHRDDLYICGAKNSPGVLFVQDENGHFRKTNTKIFEADKISEDTDCAFFDADGDGDLDLYVTSGGNEFPQSSSALLDRLYINNGQGRFLKSKQMLPVTRYESSSCVQPGDFDQDGDIDLFVGIRLHPFSYGIPVNGYLLENDGHGKFSNVSGEKAPGLTRVGMITDMVWADVDGDGDPDMVIVGDWMPVKVFINDHGNFTDQSGQFGLSGTEGWWHRIIAKDLNGDGMTDFVLGNHGLNSYFKASVKKPVTMYVNDFDMNGSVEQIICTYNGNKSYPVAMRDDLIRQIPSLARKYKTFDDYKDQTIQDIFSDDVLQRSVILKACYMQSCVMINTGRGTFKLYPLPVEAQFTPVYAIAADDFDHDGICDILLGGNQYRAKPETGIYDAGYGLFLKGTNGVTWQSVSPLNSGFFTKGEMRDLKFLNVNQTPILEVVRNNDKPEFYKY